MGDKERYDRGDIRRMNAVSVLNQLRMHGELSRANIATRLGLTRATVSSIVADLLESSIVNETSYLGVGAGRPGLLLTLNPNVGCMIAVEIDIDRISLVLANVGQEVLLRQELPLALGAPATEVLDAAAKLIEAALVFGDEKGLACLGVGVAWAGLVKREDGELAYGPTTGWEHVPIKADWEARFGLPIYVENEAHAGAIGAHHFGKTRGVQNLVYLSLGAGLAAGIFVDGVLIRGKKGFAGQVGHTFFADNGVKCGCGKEGCWVTEVGSAAIRRKLEAAGIDVSSSDWLDDVLALAQAGDVPVLHVLEGVGRQLGQGLSALVQTFNPKLLIVGGRLGRLMTCVEPVIMESLRASTLAYMSEGVELLVDEGSEDTGPTIGCLATVFDSIMKNPNSLKALVPD